MGFPDTLGSSNISRNASLDSSMRSLLPESTAKTIPYIYVNDIELI